MHIFVDNPFFISYTAEVTRVIRHPKDIFQGGEEVNTVLHHFPMVSVDTADEAGGLTGVETAEADSIGFARISHTTHYVKKVLKISHRRNLS